MNVTAKPKSVVAKIGKHKVSLKEVKSHAEFLKVENAYFYDAAPNLNKFATKGSEFENIAIIKNPQLLVKLAKTDVTANEVALTLKGYEFAPTNSYLASTGKLVPPVGVKVTKENTGPYSLKPTWDKLGNADYYE
ncbi:MAG: alpha-xylosidase, partial [Cytophagaceae bacterium]